MGYVIGIDCSTSAVKVVVFDGEGNQIALGRSPLTMQYPRPGWCEQDALEWVDAMKKAFADVRQKFDLEKIEAVGVTCQRETFVLVDSENIPIRPAISWMDTRASAQVREHGQEHVHQITGKPPATVNGHYKLIWLYENEPQSISAAVTVWDVSGYLMNALTGERKTNFATMDTLSLLDMEKREYSKEMLDLAGLDRSQMPELVATAEMAGNITPQASIWSGLIAGTPVVSTLGDGQAAAIAANVVNDEYAYLSLGTGIALGAATTDYSYSRAYRTLEGYKPGTYYLETLVANGSYLVSWFVNEFGVAGLEGASAAESPEVTMERLAQEVPPGSNGLFLLPYFNGCMTPHWDGDARGAFIGWSGSHGRAEMYRAILEGITFDIKICLDGIEAARGRPVSKLVVMGGGSNSQLWCQIIADICERTVQECSQEEVTALGAAIHAAAAVRIDGFDSIEAAAATMSKLGEAWQPDPDTSKTYRRYYAIYQKLYDRLKPIYDEIAVLETL